MKRYFKADKALGCEVVLNLVSDKGDNEIEELFRQLWLYIFKFEKAFSRFLPGSQLSIFNKSAGLKFPITDEFKEILISAKKLALKTDGLYNPFILPALQKAGYVHSFSSGFEHDLVDDYSTKKVTDIYNLFIDDTWASIPYGTAIDLGGMGKGYLADQLSNQIKGKTHGFWFSLGGDIVAGGCDENNKPWQIFIEDVNIKDSMAGYVESDRASNIGVATSSTNSRYGIRSGKKWHHIIDPRTLLPAKSDIIGATIVSESTLEADVLAKCAIILGSQKAIKFLEENKIENYCLQLSSSNQPIIHGDSIKLDSLKLKKHNNS
jgi:thiamine biosynthesis lipoprotein